MPWTVSSYIYTTDTTEWIILFSWFLEIKDLNQILSICLFTCLFALVVFNKAYCNIQMRQINHKIVIVCLDVTYHSEGPPKLPKTKTIHTPVSQVWKNKQTNKQKKKKSAQPLHIQRTVLQWQINPLITNPFCLIHLKLFKRPFEIWVNFLKISKDGSYL